MLTRVELGLDICEIAIDARPDGDRNTHDDNGYVCAERATWSTQFEGGPIAERATLSSAMMKSGISSATVARIEIAVPNIWPSHISGPRG